MYKIILMPGVLIFFFIANMILPWFLLHCLDQQPFEKTKYPAMCHYRQLCTVYNLNRPQQVSNPQEKLSYLWHVYI